MVKVFKYGCLGVSGAFILLLISLPFLFKQAFGPLEENIEIEQNIGGTLLCNSVYNADHHSWQYDIDYKYKDEKGKVYPVGNGSYYGREWDKNEQLIQFGDWLILKTGGLHDSDKILIGQLDANEWNSFEISPETIERDSLWISEDIYSKMSWLPQEAFIKEIENEIIKVDYLYRIGETVDEQEERSITYEIDKSTGRLRMTRIELKR